MILVHDFILSCECYKVRLLLNLLDLDFTTKPVDVYPGREHTSLSFRSVNPFGRVPVLDDGPRRLLDTKTILISLASTHDASDLWWPPALTDTQIRAAEWLFHADHLRPTAQAARRHAMFGESLDVTAAREGARQLFRVLDDQLAGQEFAGMDWLVADHPTLADIAWFPATALAGDGGITLMPYPAIQRWLRRVQRLPGFQPMPGIV